MGSDMFIRALYLPAGHTVDLDAAKQAATRLARNATLDDLDHIIDNGAFPDTDIDGIEPPVWTWMPELIAQHADVLRRWVEACLHQALDTLTESLQHRDLSRFPFSRHPNGGVDAYLTGGASSGDSPSYSYTAWNLVYDDDRLPDGWADALGAAAGFLHPHGTGPAARAVTFYTWA